jgi:hypothetical protein
MELHFSRADAALEQLVWDYIRAGQYPVWPYAGAAFIEKEFRSGGLDSVRQWIQLLRKDPRAAQSRFDGAR